MLAPDLLQEASSPEVAATFDTLWAAEAQDRLAAYQRGEVGSIPLAQVLAKHPNISLPES